MRRASVVVVVGSGLFAVPNVLLFCFPGRFATAVTAPELTAGPTVVALALTAAALVAVVALVRWLRLAPALAEAAEMHRVAAPVAG